MPAPRYARPALKRVKQAKCLCRIRFEQLIEARPQGRGGGHALVAAETCSLIIVPLEQLHAKWAIAARTSAAGEELTQAKIGPCLWELRRNSAVRFDDVRPRASEPSSGSKAAKIGVDRRGRRLDACDENLTETVFHLFPATVMFKFYPEGFTAIIKFLDVAGVFDLDQPFMHDLREAFREAVGDVGRSPSKNSRDLRKARDELSWPVPPARQRPPKKRSPAPEMGLPPVGSHSVAGRLILVRKQCEHPIVEARLKDDQCIEHPQQ